MYTQSKYPAGVYRSFQAIDPVAWREIIRFYEAQEQAVRSLPFEWFFDLMAAYTEALFETGAYGKHVLMADAVIEASVMEGVRKWRGQDIYRLTLFRKAASCYHLRRMEEAIHILRELLRMDARDRDARRFLVRCLVERHPAVLRREQALLTASVLVGLTLFLVEMFVIRNFFPGWSGYLWTLAWIGIVTGTGFLAARAGWHRWQCRRAVDLFLSERSRCASTNATDLTRGTDEEVGRSV